MSKKIVFFICLMFMFNFSYADEISEWETFCDSSGRLPKRLWTTIYGDLRDIGDNYQESNYQSKLALSVLRPNKKDFGIIHLNIVYQGCYPGKQVPVKLSIPTSSFVTMEVAKLRKEIAELKDELAKERSKDIEKNNSVVNNLQDNIFKEIKSIPKMEQLEKFIDTQIDAQLDTLKNTMRQELLHSLRSMLVQNQGEAEAEADPDPDTVNHEEYEKDEL